MCPQNLKSEKFFLAKSTDPQTVTYSPPLGNRTERSPIDLIRILTVGLERACDRVSCRGNNLHLRRFPRISLSLMLVSVIKYSYLGILLSNDLKWNSHVNNIVAKANRSLGFVKRNLYPCNETTKRLAYVTIVKPTLEYATAVWDPYRQEQIDSIEAVQRRAARECS